MTDTGALLIGLGLWFGLWSLGGGIEAAAEALNAAVEYVTDNWGVFEKEDETK